MTTLEDRLQVEVGPRGRRTGERRVRLFDRENGRAIERTFRLPGPAEYERHVIQRQPDRLAQFLVDAAVIFGEDGLMWVSAEIFDAATQTDRVFTESERRRPLVFHDAADIADGEQTQAEQLVEGLAWAGQLLAIHASPKSCKTLCGVVELSVSLATGTPVWNKFFVPQRRRVLLFSGEIGLPRLVEACGLAAAARGATLQDLRGFLTLCDDVPALTK